MTPAELLALADAATQPKGGWKDAGLVAIREYDKAVQRLGDMAPDLARLVAEMGEALEQFWAGDDEALNETRSALAKLSELEAR